MVFVRYMWQGRFPKKMEVGPEVLQEPARSAGGSNISSELPAHQNDDDAEQSDGGHAQHELHELHANLGADGAEHGGAPSLVTGANSAVSSFFVKEIPESWEIS